MILRFRRILQKLRNLVCSIFSRDIDIVSFNGTNIIGYFTYAFGGSQAARDIVGDYIRKRKEISLFEIRLRNHTKLTDNEQVLLQPYFRNDFPYKNNLFLLDLEFIPKLNNIRPNIFRNRINSIFFWWEFEDGFEHRFENLRNIHHVIVYSKFIYNACKDKLPTGISLVRKKYPFRKNWQIVMSRKKVRHQYGISSSAFVFFFNFDYRSSFNRKNPIGLLSALYILKEKGVSDFVCIIKTSNASFEPKKNKLLEKTIANNGLGRNIILINTVVPKNMLMSIMKACDCYVSLHRGEGLGLGMLEAKSMGLSVIATGYGGNVEFMEGEEGSFLVKYKLVEAHDDNSIYRFVTKWAEPDYAHAADCMLKVVRLYRNKKKR